MKYQPVIVAIVRIAEKILYCDGSLICEQFDSDLALIGIHDYHRIVLGECRFSE